MPPTASNPTVAYDPLDVFSFPVGATALRYGDLVKISSALMVPLSANDKQIEVAVALNNCDASSAKEGQFVWLRDAKRVEITYTAAPTRGLAYGVDGPRTLDQSDTTNKLLTVLSVDTDRGTCDVAGYFLAS